MLTVRRPHIMRCKSEILARLPLNFALFESADDMEAEQKGMYGKILSAKLLTGY